MLWATQGLQQGCAEAMPQLENTLTPIRRLAPFSLFPLDLLQQLQLHLSGCNVVLAFVACEFK